MFLDSKMILFHSMIIDHGYLESCINNIYPSEMIVNKTNVSVQKTNFLDMTISIYRGKFTLNYMINVMIKILM